MSESRENVIDGVVTKTQSARVRHPPVVIASPELHVSDWVRSDLQGSCWNCSEMQSSHWAHFELQAAGWTRSEAIDSN